MRQSLVVRMNCKNEGGVHCAIGARDWRVQVLMSSGVVLVFPVAFEVGTSMCCARTMSR